MRTKCLQKYCKIITLCAYKSANNSRLGAPNQNFLQLLPMDVGEPTYQNINIWRTLPLKQQLHHPSPRNPEPADDRNWTMAFIHSFSHLFIINIMYNAKHNFFSFMSVFSSLYFKLNTFFI